MTTPTPLGSADRVREAFFDLGVQYYVLGRSAVFAQLPPVCGSLLHHAVEMFLKGALAHRGLQELKNVGHRLWNLWELGKAHYLDASLDRFDCVVTGLDKFEEIRYPDKALATGMQIYIELVAPARAQRSIFHQ